MNDPVMTEGTGNVFQDLGFPSEEAEKLAIRADLMLKIKTLIETQNWTLEEAAAQLGESVDRVEALKQGKMSQFQIEQLITMLTSAGMKVRIEVMPNVA